MSTAMIRRPWVIPLCVLLVLTGLALIDRREVPDPDSGNVVPGAIDVLGSIEPDAVNPVQSIVRIQWSSYPNAERYEVRFFSTDMQEVARHPVRDANTFTMDLRDVWRPVAPARVVLWRVVALRHDEDIAVSALQTLRLP